MHSYKAREGYKAPGGRSPNAILPKPTERLHECCNVLLVFFSAQKHESSHATRGIFNSEAIAPTYNDTMVIVRIETKVICDILVDAPFWWTLHVSTSATFVESKKEKLLTYDATVWIGPFQLNLCTAR